VVADDAVAWGEYPRQVEEIAVYFGTLRIGVIHVPFEFMNAPVMCRSASRTARVTPLLPWGVPLVISERMGIIAGLRVEG
jgi:hypothetical protein